jgi:hypothetical protein
MKVRLQQSTPVSSLTMNALSVLQENGCGAQKILQAAAFSRRYEPFHQIEKAVLFAYVCEGGIPENRKK